MDALKILEAKITYLFGDFPYYYVSSRDACHDDTDRSAYDELLRSNDHSIQMGKVCVERVRNTKNT